jgi:hypothetical protein
MSITLAVQTRMHELQSSESTSNETERARERAALLNAGKI